MPIRFQFGMKTLLLATTVVCILAAIPVFVFRVLELNYRIPHPSESDIAGLILKLGGAYHLDRKNAQHITGVWLDDTPTTDADVQMITQNLKYLQTIHLSRTRVTDASLEALFSCPHLQQIRISGTKITSSTLSKALKNSKGRVRIDL